MIDLLRFDDPQRELRRRPVSGRANKFMQPRTWLIGSGPGRSLTRISGHLSPRMQSCPSYFGATILRANHRTAGNPELLTRENKVQAQFSPRIGFEVRYFSGAHVSGEGQPVARIKERPDGGRAIGRTAIGPRGSDLYMAHFG